MTKHRNVPIKERKNKMKTRSLRDAVQVLATLAAVGCQVRAEGDALHIHDPHEALTDDLRQAINQHKLAILSLLLRNTLRRLLQVLDMAQPSIPVGVQEDFATAWLAAVRMVGEPWAGEETPEAWQR
jgi:hypothetical protein